MLLQKRTVLANFWAFIPVSFLVSHASNSVACNGLQQGADHKKKKRRRMGYIVGRNSCGYVE